MYMLQIYKFSYLLQLQRLPPSFNNQLQRNVQSFGLHNIDEKYKIFMLQKYKKVPHTYTFP